MHTIFSRSSAIIPLLWTGLLLPAHVMSGAEKINEFTLKSSFGKEYSLKDFADKDAVVVVFVGTECPLVNLYAPRLKELAQKYAGRVAFIGVDSNQQDSNKEITAFQTRHKIDFPILKDPGNVIADQFGAVRNPEVYLLGKDRTIVYRGRIDDQYGFSKGVGFQKPAAKRNDLAEALSEHLAGKPVSVSTTESAGCRIGRLRKPDEKSDITYSKQVSRIFQQACVDCHRAGQLGPFPMTSYSEVVGWGEMIEEVLNEGRMPPWHANPSFGHFQNDRRLSDSDKETILRWIKNGCPEGDAADLPAPKTFAEGWSIGKPDEIIKMRDTPVSVPAEGVVGYYHFVVDPGWKEDKWIMAAEAKPGSPECVHHILVFLQPPPESEGSKGPSPAVKKLVARKGRDGGPRGGGISNGNLLAGYAPGANPLFASDGSVAMLAKAGSKLIFQLHYTPNGVPQQDLSYVGFKYVDPKDVVHEARSGAIINLFFAIPAGAENHPASADDIFEYDTTITCLTPHMHTRGKSFRYEATYPDGKKEVLLDVPAYDFNWQTAYHLKEPKNIPKGTKLTCTASWDNSEGNLSNPDPTKKVTWGDQTFEEMMIGFYVEQFPKGKAPPRKSPGRMLSRIDPKKVFAQMDADKDGKLGRDELPDALGGQMALGDSNRDGFFDEQEFVRIFNVFKMIVSQVR